MSKKYSYKYKFRKALKPISTKTFGRYIFIHYVTKQSGYEYVGKFTCGLKYISQVKLKNLKIINYTATPRYMVLIQYKKRNGLNYVGLFSHIGKFKGDYYFRKNIKIKRIRIGP